MAITVLRRREMLVGASAALLLPSLPNRAAARSDLVVTPGQTEGPFYPTYLPADTDADLVRVQGQKAQALGQVAHIAGRVLNRRGEAVPGAQVEIWQCDANGIYHHPSQPGLQRRDSAFQGFGRTEVAADGGYRFRTIRPCCLPWSHAAHPLQGARAGCRPPDHPDVHRRRASERHRRGPQTVSAMPGRARASSYAWRPPMPSSRGR